jgi:hypothetical protein
MNLKNSSVNIELEFMPSRERMSNLKFKNNLEQHLVDFFKFLSIEVETIEVNNTSGEEMKTIKKPDYKIHNEPNGSPRLKVDSNQILVRGDPFKPHVEMLENGRRL